MTPVRAETLYDGAVERLILSRPRANILDREMIEALRGHLGALQERPELKLILIEGEGAHFSFGASVEEHLPGAVEAMLPRFHGLFRDLEALSVPTAAVVRGQCLGGAAELASWCGRVYADGTARLGFPEIRLGVFPPVAALSLRWRAGGSRATDLVITGETIPAERAHALGLVDVVTDDPLVAARTWFEESLLGLSAASLRHAWRAVRLPLYRALQGELPELERLYLAELMSHPDPTEGLTAFLERRLPAWRQQ